MNASIHATKNSTFVRILAILSFCQDVFSIQDMIEEVAGVAKLIGSGKTPKYFL